MDCLNQQSSEAPKFALTAEPNLCNGFLMCGLNWDLSQSSCTPTLTQAHERCFTLEGPKLDLRNVLPWIWDSFSWELSFKKSTVSGSIVRNWLYSGASQILVERRVPCLRVTTCALCFRQKIGSSVSVIASWKHGLQDSSEPAPDFNCCASQQVCLRTTSSRENTVHTRNISEQHVGMLFKSHPTILGK